MSCVFGRVSNVDKLPVGTGGRVQRLGGRL